MRIPPWLLLFVCAGPAGAAPARQTLPPLHDGAILQGPGEFRHDGELFVQGKITLKNMNLALHGPIRVAAGATLELDEVQLQIWDPDGAPNGVSGLRCEGPAHIIVRHSTMVPAGSAHPMWGLQGQVDVDGFATVNSEFHLNKAQARLNQLKIFELEISHASTVTANGLDLVFLSTHTSDDDHVRFENVPVDRPFSRTLALGSGAHADLAATRIQFFLLYVHGHAEAQLARMDRVQLAIAPECDGTLRLPRGRSGSAAAPAVFPNPAESNCPFRISLNDVNVDTWDVYAAGQAKLTLENSQIDELVAGGHAEIHVRKSDVYADWLAVAGDAAMHIEDSTVGALRLAADRPDLATSQVRVSGHGSATFDRVRFDCGIVAQDQGQVSITRPLTAPKYMRRTGEARIRLDGKDAGS
jgi:hypothetical protein